MVARFGAAHLDNVETNGDNTNENTAGYETYESSNISIQRCTFVNSYQGIYHKIALAGADVVTTSARFNIFGTGVTNGVEYAGNSGRPPNNYALVQSNLFLGAQARVWPRDGSPSGECQQPHMSNNVFDTVGTGDKALSSVETLMSQYFITTSITHAEERCSTTRLSL